MRRGDRRASHFRTALCRLRCDLRKMRLLLTGKNLLDIKQNDHALTRIDLANSRNELLIDSGSYCFRRGGDVLPCEIENFSDGVHHESRLYAAQIHDDDAS